jgi:hypothetical protein
MGQRRWSPCSICTWQMQMHSLDSHCHACPAISQKCVWLIFLLNGSVGGPYRPAQQVWSDGELINDAGRASSHNPILLGWRDIGSLLFQSMSSRGLWRAVRMSWNSLLTSPPRPRDLLLPAFCEAGGIAGSLFGGEGRETLSWVTNQRGNALYRQPHSAPKANLLRPPRFTGTWSIASSPTVVRHGR